MSIILIYKGLNIKLFPYGFYQIEGKRKRCPCGKAPEICKSNQCKILGEKIGIKVGSQICEHERRRSQCKECGGSEICEHERLRSRCKECGGSEICLHGRFRSRCKECGGSEICEHNKQKSHCKECGGSQICLHGRLRSRCKECGGSQICQHNKIKNECSICQPENYIIYLRRHRRNNALKNKSKNYSTKEDLGITLEEWYEYLENTFEKRYGRKRTEQDDVHLDEIIPCSEWNLPEDNKYCWHYLNSQFLLAEDNLSKYNKYNEKDKLDMIDRIKELDAITSTGPEVEALNTGKPIEAPGEKREFKKN